MFKIDSHKPSWHGFDNLGKDCLFRSPKTDKQLMLLKGSVYRKNKANMIQKNTDFVLKNNEFLKFTGKIPLKILPLVKRHYRILDLDYIQFYERVMLQDKN